jgi:hypothetical protein
MRSQLPPPPKRGANGDEIEMDAHGMVPREQPIELLHIGAYNGLTRLSLAIPCRLSSLTYYVGLWPSDGRTLVNAINHDLSDPWSINQEIQGRCGACDGEGDPG